MGMLSLALLPLDQVSVRAGELYAKAERMVHELEAAGAPRGLLKQYEIQLERLRPGGEKAGPVSEMLGIGGAGHSIEPTEACHRLDGGSLRLGGGGRRAEIGVRCAI